MPIELPYGVTLTVEAALSSDTGTYGVWDSGRWDTATWGPGIVWGDISPWVRRVTTDRKFSRELQAWEAGKASLTLDDRDGRFSPDNLDGPYVSAGITQLRPLLPVRVQAAYAGITYPVFRGYALDYQESTSGGANMGDAVCVVPCVDEWAQLAKFGGLAQTPAGAGEYSGVRVHRVLNAAGHTGERAIDVGRVTLQETDLSQRTTEELQSIVESEGGGCWIEADGTVYFENQYALIENTRSNTVQSTWGGSGGLPYTNAQLSYSADLIKTIAVFAREGGAEQLATDLTARALYGELRETKTDLICETDAQVLNLANFYLERYKNPERRVTEITVAPLKNPDVLFPEVLGRKVRDLIRVIRRPPGGYTVTRDCHIAGITHDFTLANWSTKFGLWSATPYLTYATSRWDVGRWDSATWFF